jgi:hypothetical protein
VGSGDRAPAFLGGLDQLEHAARAAAGLPAPPVTFVRSFTVENFDSMAFVVRRWTQCSAGKT